MRAHNRTNTNLSIRLFTINPFVPSVPKNGTPNLTAFIKIIQALMGYTPDNAYVALNKLLAAMNLLRYLLRYKNEFYGFCRLAV